MGFVYDVDTNYEDIAGAPRYECPEINTQNQLVETPSLCASRCSMVPSGIIPVVKNEHVVAKKFSPALSFREHWVKEIKLGFYVSYSQNFG